MKGHNFFNLLLCKLIAIILILAMFSFTSGCCTMFSEKSQTITVKTVPEGKIVRYQGVKIKDGGTVYIKKEFKAPQFYIGGEGGFYFVDLDYNPNLWLIGDCGLLLLGLIPGLIGFGIDFGTGAWRDFDNPQVIYLPEPK